MIEKGNIVRSKVCYRKHIKFSQLNRVESSKQGPSGQIYITLTNIAIGTVMENVPATEMILVSKSALQKLFEVSSKSSQVF